jgi:RNase P subunit RPR2
MGMGNQEVHVNVMDDRLTCSRCKTPLQLHGRAATGSDGYQYISECSQCDLIIRLQIDVVRVFSKTQKVAL